MELYGAGSKSCRLAHVLYQLEAAVLTGECALVTNGENSEKRKLPQSHPRVQVSVVPGSGPGKILFEKYHR